MTTPTSSRLKTILLVDDNDRHRVATKWFLATFGFAVDVTRSAEEALALFDPRVHDVVITGNAMAGMTGVEMAHIIKLRSSATPVVMFSRLPLPDRKCLDSIIQEPAHLLTVKEAVDLVLAAKRK